MENTNVIKQTRVSEIPESSQWYTKSKQEKTCKNIAWNKRPWRNQNKVKHQPLADLAGHRNLAGLDADTWRGNCTSPLRSQLLQHLAGSLGCSAHPAGSKWSPVPPPAQKGVTLDAVLGRAGSALALREGKNGRTGTTTLSFSEF